jgi:hypothetical protein
LAIKHLDAVLRPHLLPSHFSRLSMAACGASSIRPVAYSAGRTLAEGTDELQKPKRRFPCQEIATSHLLLEHRSYWG